MKNTSGLYLEDFYILRTPVYPIEYVLELNDLFLRIDSPVEGQDAIKEIREKFSDPLFMEAIFYASKELFTLLNDWLQNPVYDKESQKLIRSLHRYYSRMCTRCTPFGLFAGCHAGEIKASPTELVFEMENRIKRHVRLDGGLLAELASNLSNNNESYRYIKFRLNDMLYRRGGKVAFMESMLNGSGTSYRISAISETKYLNFIISIIGSGRYPDEIIDSLVQFDSGISRDRYEKYVLDLISCQFLMSELMPNVTGDHLTRLMKIFASNSHFNNVNATLTRVHGIIADPSRHENYFIDVQSVIEPLQLAAAKKNSLQLDVHLQLQNNVLNRKIAAEIVGTSEELWKINRISNTGELNSFIERFKARYEDQAIPLLTAMDSDVGIGYGVAVNGNTENMPLLAGVAFQSYELQVQKSKSAFEEFVGKIYHEFLENKEAVINLKEHEIAELINKARAREPENFQHTSAFVFGSILSKSAADLDNGNYKFLATQLHNHSSGRMLGRLASGNEKLLDLVLRHNQTEELLNSNAIIAEVVHSPTGHAINVAIRPRVRNYEIPILCSPSVEDDFLIPLQDLLIVFRNNRLMLISRKHNKEVIPRITNAFNAQKGEPIYRLLADMAAQLTRLYFQWDWFDFENKMFLPRIEYKKFVLERARWNIRQIDPAEYKSEAQCLEYFNDMKSRYSIPRYVVQVQDTDNELLIDTENPFCLGQLVRVLKRRSVILVEHLSTPENCFVTSGRFHFNNQVVIPLGTDRSAFPLSGDNDAGIEDHTVSRSFAPGSNWVYFKVYGGNKTLDLMIPSVFKPLAEEFIENGIAEKWFFIRYNDPNSHLRIRFYCSKGNFKEVMDRLNKTLSPFIERNELDKFVIDTYKREIERYGADLIEDSETLFYNDSVAVTQILDSIDGDEGDHIRWLAALKSVDSLLSDFNLKLSRKQLLLESLAQMFFKEFATGDAKSDKRLKVSLNNKYRVHSADIGNALNNKQFLDSFLFSVFEQRSNANRKVVMEILDKVESRHNSEEALDRFLRSHIHMNVNRLFISKPRKHEMVLYHFLNEYYRSQIAIQKAKSKISQNDHSDAKSKVRENV